MPKGKQQRGGCGDPKLIIDKEPLTGLCRLLEGGFEIVTSCEAAGISRQAYYEHTRKMDGIGLLLTRARAEGLLKLQLEARDGKTGAQWTLERVARDRFGNQQRIEHSGPDGGPIRTQSGIDDKLDALTVDELRDLARKKRPRVK